MNDKLIPLLRSLFSELPHPALLEAADRLENAKVIFEKIGIDGGCSAATQERLIRHLLDALERIANLKSVTQTKGPLEHMGTPEHLMDPEGWGPIQPAVKTGLCIAARIADAALDSLPGVNVKKNHANL